MKSPPLPILITALSLFTPLAAYCQGEKPGNDPFLKSDAPPPAAAPAQEESVLPREGLVRMEVFTLSKEEARAATRKFPKQTDLYAWLGGELEKEKPTVKLERLMVLRIRSGAKAKVEEIAEYPYPTEFDAPRIPQTIGIGHPAAGISNVTVTNPPAPSSVHTVKPAGAKGDPGPAGAPGPLPRPPGSAAAGSIFSPWPYTAATLHSFELKNTGWKFEAELVISDDGFWADLNMAPQFIRFCGLESQSPTGEIIQPVFETSSIACQLMTKLGEPTLAGTFSPPVDAGAEGGNMENVARLLFVTVTDPR